MDSMKLHALVIWLHHLESWAPAILVTLGLALLIGCAFGCTCTPNAKKDRLFHREVF
jgi:hypothetical protein